MRSPKSSGRPKKPRFIIRQVTGVSMHPALKTGRIIIGSGRFSVLKPGDIVVIRHNGIEKIKRITEVDDSGNIFVQGDNSMQSTDSRHFGWLSRDVVIAILVWPRR